MFGKTLTTLLLVSLVYGGLLVILYVKQESLIFPGRPLPADFEFQFDVPFRELTIPVDGAELNALHFQQDDPDGVIFFLHGNGGNLVDWTVNIDWYRRNNYDLFIFDYRGYGKSTGAIASQEQLLNDVRAAWRTMRPYYAGRPIVIYGRSLGSALAARLATEVESELLVLVSPFTSMIAMAREHYPFVPGALVRYPLRTDAVIGAIETPVVIMHGDEDDFIPMVHSKQLLARARSSARFFRIEGAGHNDIHQYPAYLAGLARVLPQ